MILKRITYTQDLPPYRHSSCKKDSSPNGVNSFRSICRVEGGRGGISRWGVAVASDFRHVLVPQSIP